jgi:hypothetical protein
MSSSRERSCIRAGLRITLVVLVRKIVSSLPFQLDCQYADVQGPPALTGCVLRIVITHPPILAALGFSERKELVKTYVVDPHFVKSNDAKMAVCIVAVTQNVREYLSDISKKYEEKTQTAREFERVTSESFVKVVAKLLMRLDPRRKISFDHFGSGVPVKGKAGGDNPIGTWIYLSLTSFLWDLVA